MRLLPVLRHLGIITLLTIAFGAATCIAEKTAHQQYEKVTEAHYVEHERRSHPPAGWTLTARADAHSTLPQLRFGLLQQNTSQLEALLMDVSDPGSPNYGRHWTAQRVRDTFAPSTETLAAVRKWLEVEEGFEPARMRVTPGKGWVVLENATVAEAERLLRTEYHVYEHRLRRGQRHVACHSYHLPAHIAPHIEIVTPSIHFDAVLKGRSGDVHEPAKNIGLPGAGLSPKTTGTVDVSTLLLNELENCDQLITPACLRALYGLVYEPLATRKNSLGIVEYTPQAYLQSDLDMFSANFSKGLVGASPQVVSVDGGIVQTIQMEFDLNAESNLDLQYSMALVNPLGHHQNVTLYQVGDLPQGASFNNLLDALDGSYCSFQGGDDPDNDGIYPDSDYPGGYDKNDCGIRQPAHVISTSYAYNEADLSPAYTARQCAEYAKLGLMGVTMVFSSGDYGVAGNADMCLNDDGSQSEDGQIFNPSFPGTCPYVTTVGATQVNPGKNVTDRESACQQVIFSGGGFSNHFPIPGYQKKVVGKYFDKFRPIHGDNVYNATGASRAYPDISANGANYLVAVNGRFSRVFGTSASAPVVASILTLVNDARLAVGKRPIGFINPTIYSDLFRGAFNDITDGGNPGCNTEGFTAVQGWDPVAGLGTPNFPKLVARWLLLP